MATETFAKPTAAEVLEFEASRLRGRIIADTERLVAALEATRDALARGALPQIPNASAYGFLLADMGALVSKLEAVKTIRSMQARNA